MEIWYNIGEEKKRGKAICIRKEKANKTSLNFSDLQRCMIYLLKEDNHSYGRLSSFDRKNKYFFKTYLTKFKFFVIVIDEINKRGCSN